MILQPKTRFCHLCGKPISGRYFRYATGLIVCGACEAANPRCARCNIPVASDAPELRVSSGNAIHLCRACEREASRCAACGDPILTAWYTFEELPPGAAERRFCPRCVQSRPRCDLCHAPCAAPPAVLSDGQYRCALCYADMATSEAEIRAAYAEAAGAFTRIVGSPLRETPTLKVVGRRQMGETRRHYVHAASAADATRDTKATRATQAPTATSEDAASHHVLGYFVRSHGASTIYIEMGLTRGLLLGTLAHELAHAWQAERLGHEAANVAPLIGEGFAEWVAYHTLLAKGLPTLAARATRRDDLYGRGLRHFLAIERAEGRDAAVRAALRGK